MQEIKHLSLLQIVSQDGTILVSTDQSRVGLNRLSSPYFLAAIAGQARVHDPRYIAEAGGVYIAVSVPIRDANGRVLGVAAARVSLDDLDRLAAADSNYGSLGEFGMLWDEQGIVLSSPWQPALRLHPLAPLIAPTRNRLVAEARYGPDTARLLDAPASAADLVARSRWRLYDPEASPHVTTQIGGGRVQLTSVPVRGTRWTYGVGTPEENALAAVRLESRRNVARRAGDGGPRDPGLARGGALGDAAARRRRQRRACTGRRRHDTARPPASPRRDRAAGRHLRLHGRRDRAQGRRAAPVRRRSRAPRGRADRRARRACSTPCPT